MRATRSSDDDERARLAAERERDEDAPRQVDAVHAERDLGAPVARDELAHALEVRRAVEGPRGDADQLVLVGLALARAQHAVELAGVGRDHRRAVLRRAEGGLQLAALLRILLARGQRCLELVARRRKPRRQAIDLAVRGDQRRLCGLGLLAPAARLLQLLLEGRELPREPLDERIAPLGQLEPPGIGRHAQPPARRLGGHPAARLGSRGTQLADPHRSATGMVAVEADCLAGQEAAPADCALVRTMGSRRHRNVGW